MLTRKGPTYVITSKNIVSFGPQIIDLASVSITQWTNVVQRSNVIHTIFKNFFGSLPISRSFLLYIGHSFHPDSTWKRSSETFVKLTSAECTVENS